MAGGYTFHQSYYEATKKLAPEERIAIFDAMNAYAFEGTDTEFEDANLDMAWNLIKPNIDSSLKRSKTNAENRRKRTVKTTVPTTVETEDATTVPPESIGMERSGEDMDGKGEERNTPSFPLRCLDALNRVLGTPYTTIPGECLHTLERFDGTYPVDDVEAMIRAKYDEWHDKPKTRAWLTPNTLFAPDKFERYMIQTLQTRKEDASDDFNGSAIEL